MKITLDNKLVEAVNHGGSELWTLASGEIRHLKQDFSAHLKFNTVSVIKEAPAVVEKEMKKIEKKFEKKANTANT